MLHKDFFLEGFQDSVVHGHKTVLPSATFWQNQIDQSVWVFGYWLKIVKSSQSAQTK